MKNRIIGLTVLWLFVLSGPAFAANWVYFISIPPSVGHSAGQLYYDTDTVVRDGDRIFFWNLNVLDNTRPDGTKNFLFRQEAILSNPRMERTVEVCGYTEENRKTYHETVSEEFRQVKPGSYADREIDAVLPYAR